MVEETQLNVNVPKDAKEEAKRKTEYGEITRHIRRVIESLAEGDHYEVHDVSERGYSHLEECQRPPDWKSRQEGVLLRDDYTCQNCHEHGGRDGPKELVAHHVVPASAGGNHYLSNLVTLCRECHEKAHRAY